MPRISQETISLIQEIARDNRLWGAERIRSELFKLGIRVCKRTIEKFMRQVRSTRPHGQTWKTFLHTHAEPIWECDFLPVTDLLFRSLLREMGLDPESSEARRAVGLVRDHVTWPGWGPEGADNPFFAGEVEPCINGQVAESGAYFGQGVRGIIDRLLGEQLADGGWNCEAPNGLLRSSFNTTICVLEALLEYERADGGSQRLSAALYWLRSTSFE